MLAGKDWKDFQSCLLLKLGKTLMLTFLGKRLLIEYEIIDEKMIICSTEPGNISYAQIDVIFKRKYENHLSNTYLQTLLLLIVCFLTLFFEINNFTDKIMVVLTTMLVIATIQSATQEVNLTIYILCVPLIPQQLAAGPA
jgi:hypothetical protein